MIEELGWYDPEAKDPQQRQSLKRERIAYWLSVGAQPTATARDLLKMMRAVLDGKLGPSVRGSLVDENGLDWNGLTHGFRAFADYHQASDTFVVLTANILSSNPSWSFHWTTIPKNPVRDNPERTS